ncbi:MAG TPA: BON domain-containing protein [Legionellaceae bacterium]|nr:BON domain-containing protein [Legionellaceae bacterium]
MMKKAIFGILAISMYGPIVAHAYTPNTANTEVSTKIKVTVPDAVITAEVKAQYLLTPALKSASISVETKDGIVTLKGTIDTNLQYDKAVSIAESINGVKDVTADDLYVTSSEAPIHDLYITAKVKGTLMKERFFGPKPVEYWPVYIETKNSSVYLAGTVETAEKRDAIVDVVKSVQGVHAVESLITIQQ